MGAMVRNWPFFRAGVCGIHSQYRTTCAESGIEKLEIHICIPTHVIEYYSFNPIYVCGWGWDGVGLGWVDAPSGRRL